VEGSGIGPNIEVTVILSSTRPLGTKNALWAMAPTTALLVPHAVVNGLNGSGTQLFDSVTVPPGCRLPSRYTRSH